MAPGSARLTTAADKRVEADSPDRLSRGDRGARQSRRWLASEIPLDTLLRTP